MWINKNYIIIIQGATAHWGPLSGLPSTCQLTEVREHLDSLGITCSARIAWIKRISNETIIRSLMKGMEVETTVKSKPNSWSFHSMCYKKIVSFSYFRFSQFPFYTVLTAIQISRYLNFSRCLVGTEPIQLPAIHSPGIGATLHPIIWVQSSTP